MHHKQHLMKHKSTQIVWHWTALIRGDWYDHMCCTLRLLASGNLLDSENAHTTWVDDRTVWKTLQGICCIQSQPHKKVMPHHRAGTNYSWVRVTEFMLICNLIPEQAQDKLGYHIVSKSTLCMSWQQLTCLLHEESWPWYKAKQVWRK